MTPSGAVRSGLFRSSGLASALPLVSNRIGSSPYEEYGSSTAGEVPQDFDTIDGAEAEVEAKGPLLMMGADALWEWTGANAPGFGDPLIRDPGQVEADSNYLYFCTAPNNWKRSAWSSF